MFNGKKDVKKKRFWNMISVEIVPSLKHLAITSEYLDLKDSIRSSMLLFLLLIQPFSLSGMLSMVDKIDRDYVVLTPYIVQMIERTAHECDPFALFAYFLNPEALIHKEIVCSYQTARDHILFMYRTQKLKMISDYTQKKGEFSGDPHALTRWFMDYFQKEIVPRVIRDLKRGLKA